MNSFTDTVFNKVEIEFSAFVPHRPESPFHKDRKNHGFVINAGGAKRYTFDNGTVLNVGKNDIFYLPKYSNYKVERLVHSGCYAINFDTAEKISIKEFVHTPKNPDLFLKAFQSAAKYWESKNTGYYEKTSESFFGIIYNLKKEISAQYLPQSKKAMIAPAVEYIKNHYTTENISIAYLADLCRISEPYLRKIFHSIYGTAPLEYIRSLKLSRAKELIDSGEYAIGEAARMSGFFDDSYFSREFKKEYGLSPINYNRKSK